MRIHPDVLVQGIDKNSVVIIDESVGQEVVIDEETAPRLIRALQYFFPDLFIDLTPPRPPKIEAPT